MQKNSYIFLAALVFVVLLVAEVAYLVYDPNLWLFIADRGYRDAVHAALSLGRLDLITTLLAIVTVIFSVFAIIGFGYVRARSEQIAKEASEKIAKEIADKLSHEVKQELEKMMNDAQFNYRDLLGTIGAQHGIDNIVNAIDTNASETKFKDRATSDTEFKTTKGSVEIMRSDENH